MTSSRGGRCWLACALLVGACAALYVVETVRDALAGRGTIEQPYRTVDDCLRRFDPLSLSTCYVAPRSE